MAVEKLTIDNQNTFPHYLALASDTKPETGIRVGEYLQETDTRRIFQWDGEDWNLTFVPIDTETFEARQLSALGIIVDALERIQQQLASFSPIGNLAEGERSVD